MSETPGSPVDTSEKITASDFESNDDFGGSVAISGELVIVGADGAAGDPLSEAGAAYIFTR